MFVIIIVSNNYNFYDFYDSLINNNVHDFQIIFDFLYVYMPIIINYLLKLRILLRILRYINLLINITNIWKEIVNEAKFQVKIG